MLLLAIVGGWIHAAVTDDYQRNQEVRWKRIRDELRQSSPDT